MTKIFKVAGSLLAFLVLGSTTQAQVIITELTDPDNDATARYVELYNASGVAVDLSTGWALRRWTNGNAGPQTDVALTGSIPAGGFYLIAANGANFATVYGMAASQSIGGGGPADSNGDDQIALIDNTNTLVDIFGVPGEDGSGTCHEFEDGRAERAASVTMGNATWNEAEWNVWADSPVGGCTSHTNAIRNAPGDFDPGVWIGAGGGGGCGITIGVVNATCNSITVGTTDTYDLSIPYNGVDAGTSVVNNSGSGTVGGDDPAVLSDGIITISGISETDDYDVTFTAPCDALNVLGSAPNCDPLPPLVINEVLADPSATSGDANGDGTINTTDDEFVEIVNNGAADVDISGYTLSDAVTVRHTFPAGTIISGNCAIVVFGGGTPTGGFGGAQTQIASTGQIGMNNGGDDVILADASSTVITMISFSGPSDQSVTRDPDITGATFVDHTTATGSGGAEYSAGTLVDGSFFSGCTPPACGITPGIESASCNSLTAGPGDTYDLSIPYSGMQAGISVVNNSASGTVGGDDPAVTASGTIVISGIDEADAYSVTFTTPCDGFTVAGAAPACEPLPPLVINEILADPSATSGDANGDATISTQDDEFVEIVNNGAIDLDISGYTISDAIQVRHTFPGGSVVSANCAIVVFGGGTPTGTFGGALTQISSTGSLGLNNGGDDVTLADAASTVITSVSYGGSTDQSTTRDPDITGTFVDHTGATGSGGSEYSPGTQIDGSSFAGCAAPPGGTIQLINYFCGKLDLQVGGQIICQADPAVQAEFGVGDNSDDGYQFQIEDPSSSYLRNMFISHSNHMVGVPTGASGAQYLRYSALQTLPVPVNTLLDVRVRPRLNGVDGTFGPTCQIMIQSPPSGCPLTKLIDDPNHQFFSCGVTGLSLNGSDKIVARPLAGANTYQFEFTIPSEGFLRRISISSYALVLNVWTTLPLEYAKTYDVRVRASFDGGTNYCAYGDVCSISTAAAPPMASTQRMVQSDTESAFNIWPNPNNGDQLHLSFNAEGAVTIELFDMSGKQLMARTMNVEGQQRDLLIQLPAALQPGMYMVRTSTGESVNSKRLVVR